MLFTHVLLGQEIAIELSRENILINDIENPIVVSIENLDCKHIYLYSEDAKIQQYGCKASILPNTDKKTVQISIFKITETDSSLLTKKRFRTQNIKPTAQFFGYENGTLKLEVLKNHLNHAKLSAYSEYICVKFKINTSRMLVLRNDNVIGLTQNSNETFSEATKTLLQHIEIGDEIYFLDLKCKIEDTVVNIEPLKFKIIN